jgi:hypothetical protein
LNAIASADIIVAHYAGRHVDEIADELGVPIGIVFNELMLHEQKLKAARRERRSQREKARVAKVKIERGPAAISTPVFLPSIEEIADACKAIRAGWSDQEYYRRHLIATTLGSIDDEPKRRRMTFQELRTVDFCVG